MRLDSANRSFLALMSVALLLGAYVLCGAVGACSCRSCWRGYLTADLPGC